MRSLRTESVSDTPWNTGAPIESPPEIDESFTPTVSSSSKRRGRTPKDAPSVAQSAGPEKKGSDVKKLEAKIERKVNKRTWHQKKVDRLTVEIANLQALRDVASKEDMQQQIEEMQAKLSALTAKRDGV